MCLETFLLTMSCLVERMTIGLSHPIGHVAQGGLIAGGFCMPSGLGIVGAAAIERTLCCSGGQNLFQVFWDQEVHFFLGKLGSPLPLWHSLQHIYIYCFSVVSFAHSFSYRVTLFPKHLPEFVLVQDECCHEVRALSLEEQRKNFPEQHFATQGKHLGFSFGVLRSMRFAIKRLLFLNRITCAIKTET